MSSSLRPGALVVGAAALLVVASASAASAHVTVQPPEAVAGEYAKLSFRVPNESDTAGTVALRVAFPQDTPFASVRVRPHPGWTARVEHAELPRPVQVGDTELTEAVRSITWTAADGVRLGPDQFDEFEVSVGPLPDVDTVEFPTTQTYDDGEVVAWDESAEADRAGEEAQRPAPLLTLSDAEEDASGRGGGEHATDGDGEADADASQVADDTVAADGADGADQVAATTDATARALGAAGFVVGLLGLVVAALALLGARRTRP